MKKKSIYGKLDLGYYWTVQTPSRKLLCVDIISLFIEHLRFNDPPKRIKITANSRPMEGAQRFVIVTELSRNERIAFDPVAFHASGELRMWSAMKEFLEIPTNPVKKFQAIRYVKVKYISDQT